MITQKILKIMKKKFNAVTEFGFLSVTLPVLVLILEIL